MPLLNIHDFKMLYKPSHRLLGLDVGSKTLGLALSDNRWKIASPLKTLARTKLSVDVIILKKLVVDLAIAGFECGLPLNMNGSRGPRVQATEDYMTALLQYMDIPIAFWDERLTTVMAERTLITADVSRKKRRIVIDKMAATLILQGFMDCLHAAY